MREFDFINEAERTPAIKSARVRDIRFKNERHGELSSTGGTPLYKTANRERFTETSRTRESTSNSKEGPFFRPRGSLAVVRMEGQFELVSERLIPSARAYEIWPGVTLDLSRIDLGTTTFRVGFIRIT